MNELILSFTNLSTINQHLMNGSIRVAIPYEGARIQAPVAGPPTIGTVSCITTDLAASPGPIVPVIGDDTSEIGCARRRSRTQNDNFYDPPAVYHNCVYVI